MNMAAINKVILIGNLGRDPELRRTATGSAVTDFSLATTEKFKDRDGNMKEQTEWHNIVAWNRTAETMAQYLKKGSSVYLEGKLRTRSWEDNGVKKYKTEIIVNQFQFLGGRSNDSQGGYSSGGGAKDFGEAPGGFDSGFSAPAPQAPAQPQYSAPTQQQQGYQQPQQPATPAQPDIQIDEDLPF
jgi:single-strand DNA-binding protein